MSAYQRLGARIWDIAKKRIRTMFKGHKQEAQDEAGTTSVAISPDGWLAAAGSLGTIMRLWTCSRGRSSGVYSVVFTPDGNDNFPHLQARALARARAGPGIR
ncbi:hypothetical protein JB92DRAFT_2838401 [Gautieria morchelliformis]|nr:hypothetical protein JB92DRAFT_2838401 [Gautieria morchelliformis]